MRITLLKWILFLFLSYSSFSQLTVEEHLGMENISNLQVYESNIIYAKTTKKTWNGKTFSLIIMSDLDSGNKIPITSSQFDYDPKFSPNGKWISFISYRDEMQQIYIIPVSGGQPQKASDAQAYISNYKWLNSEIIVYVDDEQKDSLLENTEKKNGGGY